MRPVIQLTKELTFHRTPETSNSVWIRDLSDGKRLYEEPMLHFLGAHSTDELQILC
jgi:hypothetical protein